MSHRWIVNNSVDCIYVSEEFTESGIMYTGEVCFCGLLILSDADMTINLYDNTEASGKNIIPTDTLFCGCEQLQLMSGQAIHCDNGIYIEMTTTGNAKIQLLYDGAF